MPVSRNIRPPALTRGPVSTHVKPHEPKLSDALVPNPRRECWSCREGLKPRSLYFCRRCYLAATTRRKIRLARRRELQPDGDPRVVVALHREAAVPRTPFDPYVHFESLTDAARYERALKILRIRPATVGRLAARIGLTEATLLECLESDARVERLEPKRGGPKRFRAAAP